MWEEGGHASVVGGASVLHFIYLACVVGDPAATMAGLLCSGWAGLAASCVVIGAVAIEASAAAAWYRKTNDRG